MNISELIRKIEQNRDCNIVTEKHCIQIYFDGKRGNIKRKNGTVVCSFDIQGERIIIAPVKEGASYEFGYTRYGIEAKEEIHKLESINHKDSTEIYEAFMNFMYSY